VEDVPAGILRRCIVQLERSLSDTSSPAVPEVAVTYGKRNATVEWNMYLACVCNSSRHHDGMTERRAQDDRRV
jgi:hypothetical protein